MNTTTLCWNCSHEYVSTEKTCPSCGSVNANLDLLTAIEQAGGYCHGLFPPSDCMSADAASTNSPQISSGLVVTGSREFDAP